MSRPKTLLEGLCEHALSCGAQALEVECEGGKEWVYVRRGDTAISVANFARSSRDAKELRANLYALRKKPLKIAIGGQVWIIKVRAFDSFGEDAFEVSIDPAPRLDPSAVPKFTKKQGQYLAFIYNYTQMHRRAPSEADLQGYFQTSPPTIHEMIKTLERGGFIERTPGQARSIRLLVRPEHLPILGGGDNS